MVISSRCNCWRGTSSETVCIISVNIQLKLLRVEGIFWLNKLKAHLEFNVIFLGNEKVYF